MKIELTYQLNSNQTEAIRSVIHEWLTVFKPDYDFIDECISHAVLMEWYKEHLPVFTFPEKINEVSLNAAQALAFLKHFYQGQYESYEAQVFQSICKDIIDLCSGATPQSQKSPDRIAEL